MSKAAFMRLAAEHGIEVEYTAGGKSKGIGDFGTPRAAEIMLDAPAGKLFADTDTHTDGSLCHHVEEDGTRTNWERSIAGLKAIISGGFEDCTDPDCDICHD